MERGGKRLRVALIYPNTSSVGLSNLGAFIVHQILLRHPMVEAHMLFWEEGPDPSPRIVNSSGKAMDLKYFHAVAFSVSFENDLLNLPQILDSYSIPIHRRERDTSHPLVIMGGVVSFSNPEPVSDFVDLFLLGEAEAFFGEFLDHMAQSYFELSREEFLLEVQRSFSYAYVPSLYEVEEGGGGTIRGITPKDPSLPRKIAVQKLDLLGKGVIAPLMGEASEACSVFQNMALLEVGRGCKRACRFCLAGHVYRPPRWFDREAIVKSLEGLDQSTKAIGLLAPSVMDMPHFEDLLIHIKESGLKCNISSVRMDSLTENVLNLIKELGQQTITLAIETGSQRLQKVINKNLTEELILQQIELISKIRFRKIKIYLMVGLPTETKDDILATVHLIKKIRHVIIKTISHKGVVPAIKVVLSCFVPKPFTPLQWCGMEELNILKERQNAIKKALYKEGGISITTDVPKWAYVQGLLARGDRRVSELILKGNKCNWDLKRLFAQSILNPEYFIRRNYSLDEYLPWDFIEHGIRKDYLVAEFMRAMEGKESPGCRPEGCKRCGVCERW